MMTRKRVNPSKHSNKKAQSNHNLQKSNNIRNNAELRNRLGSANTPNSELDLRTKLQRKRSELPSLLNMPIADTSGLVSSGLMTNLGTQTFINDRLSFIGDSPLLGRGFCDSQLFHQPVIVHDKGSFGNFSIVPNTLTVSPFLNHAIPQSPQLLQTNNPLMHTSAFSPFPNAAVAAVDVPYPAASLYGEHVTGKSKSIKVHRANQKPTFKYPQRKGTKKRKQVNPKANSRKQSLSKRVRRPSPMETSPSQLYCPDGKDEDTSLVNTTNVEYMRRNYPQAVKSLLEVSPPRCPTTSFNARNDAIRFKHNHGKPDQYVIERDFDSEPPMNTREDIAKYLLKHSNRRAAASMLDIDDDLPQLAKRRKNSRVLPELKKPFISNTQNYQVKNLRNEISVAPTISQSFELNHPDDSFGHIPKRYSDRQNTRSHDVSLKAEVPVVSFSPNEGYFTNRVNSSSFFQTNTNSLLPNLLYENKEKSYSEKVYSPPPSVIDRSPSLNRGYTMPSLSDNKFLTSNRISPNRLNPFIGAHQILPEDRNEISNKHMTFSPPPAPRISGNHSRYDTSYVAETPYNNRNGGGSKISKEKRQSHFKRPTSNHSRRPTLSHSHNDKNSNLKKEYPCSLMSLNLSPPSRPNNSTNASTNAKRERNFRNRKRNNPTNQSSNRNNRNRNTKSFDHGRRKRREVKNNKQEKTVRALSNDRDTFDFKRGNSSKKDRYSPEDSFNHDSSDEEQFSHRILSEYIAFNEELDSFTLDDAEKQNESELQNLTVLDEVSAETTD